MKKKVLAGILAATMAFSMAACGSTGSSSDSGSSAASGSTAKTEEKGEPYTVTMVLQGSQQQDEERIEEKINEILEPELNAKLDIVVLPWASASQQLQLMLSGDEKIDLLYTNATTAVQYMHSGQIMDMSELIDKYGTNLKDIYGEDIAKTNQIDGFVYSHAKGLSIEAEVGSIGGVEDGVVGAGEIADPEECAKITALGVDFLAAGIGNIHGVYPANWKGLDFEALDRIHKATNNIPLVLHGGTGIPDEMIAKAISLGVSKININTECQLVFAEATRKYIEAGKDLQGKGFDPRKLLAPGAKAIEDKCKEKIELFGCAGKG